MIRSLFSSARLKQSFHIFARFLRNPITGIQTIPDWSWPELIIHQLVFTAAAGALAGLVQSSFMSVLHGLILIPFITSILIAVGSLFFYFFFQVFAGQTLPIRKIMTLIFFANIPFFIFQIAAYWLPAITLVGLAFTGMILITGFVEKFGLERKLVFRTIILVFAMFALVWLWSRLDAMDFDRAMTHSLKAPPVQLGE